MRLYVTVQVAVSSGANHVAASVGNTQLDVISPESFVSVTVIVSIVTFPVFSTTIVYSILSPTAIGSPKLLIAVFVVVSSQDGSIVVVLLALVGASDPVELVPVPFTVFTTAPLSTSV